MHNNQCHVATFWLMASLGVDQTFWPNVCPEHWPLPRSPICWEQMPIRPELPNDWPELLLDWKLFEDFLDFPVSQLWPKKFNKKNILFGDNIIYKTKNCKQIAAKNTLYGLKMDKNRAIIWFTSQKMGENKCKLFCLLRNWCISARGAKNCTPSTEVLSKVRHACWDWRGAI